MFLDENARGAHRAAARAPRSRETCVVKAPRRAGEDRIGIVTCDDYRALKHDVNGLQEFFKSVG